MRVNKILFGILIALFTNALAIAQEQALDDQDIVNVESLYSQPAGRSNEKIQEIPPASVDPVIQTPESGSANSNTTIENPPDTENQPPAKPEKIESLTDLNKLAPFREVSIIQKKYLPKTERFQLYAAGGLTTNSPWFLNLGVKLNFGYFFTESFGLELSGMFLSNSEREVAKEIRENNTLQPEKFVNTKNHVGLDLVWAPIYGKVTFLNNRIIPFDMYFSGGVGTSSTNSQEKNNTTFHIGTGQIFAISKSMAFRWDYSWNFFQATPVPDANSTAASPGKNTYNDLILTAGISFFFPEVSNR